MVKDSIALKESDRIPIMPIMEGFLVLYAGGTFSKCMSDWTFVGKYL
jgi:hypothetical protein